MINTITTRTARPLKIMIVCERSFSDLTAGCSNIPPQGSTDLSPGYSGSYRHPSNQQCRRDNGASEIEIVPDHLYRAEHLLQGPGDRHALNRKGQLAILDPDS